MNQEALELRKSILIASEFIKVARGFKVEAERPDGLPPEIKEYLANDHLDRVLSENDIEPEMIIWGLMKVIEILLGFTEHSVDDLTKILDQFLDYIDKRDTTDEDQS
jgi:hypothetical protein